MTNSEWIPVSKELPGKTGYYRVTCEGIGKRIQTDTIYLAKKKEWPLARTRVLAWMPLPEIYKGE